MPDIDDLRELLVCTDEGFDAFLEWCDIRFFGVVTLRTCVTAGVRLYVAIGEPEIMVECRDPAELDEPARPWRFLAAL